METVTKRELTREDIAVIAKAYAKSLKAIKTLPDIADDDPTGVPIFTQDDLNQSTTELDVLVRLLFIKFNVTRKKFERQFAALAISRLGIPEMKICSQRENFIRRLKKGDISIKAFRAAVSVILDIKIEKFIIQGVCADGTSIEVVAAADKLLKTLPSQLANKKILDDD